MKDSFCLNLPLGALSRIESLLLMVANYFFLSERIFVCDEVDETLEFDTLGPNPLSKKLWSKLTIFGRA